MKYLFLLLLLVGGISCTAPIESDEWVVEEVCQKHQDRKVMTWSQYRILLTELQKPRYVVVPLLEYETAISEHTDKVVVTLRHDIDGNPCAAGAMAKLENQFGFRSSYFVNHNEEYYFWRDRDGKRRRRDATMYRWRELQSLGHEVGLHYDMLTMYYENGEDPTQILPYELWYLANQGIAVYGGVAHGSGITKRIRTSNYEIFEEFAEIVGSVLSYNNRSYTLGSVVYRDFLLYEANFMQGETHYYSDSGGSFGKMNPFSEEYGLQSLKPGDAAQILTHPVWWGKGTNDN